MTVAFIPLLSTGAARISMNFNFLVAALMWHSTSYKKRVTRPLAAVKLLLYNESPAWRFCLLSETCRLRSLQVYLCHLFLCGGEPADGSALRTCRMPHRANADICSLLMRSHGDWQESINLTVRVWSPNIAVQRPVLYMWVVIWSKKTICLLSEQQDFQPQTPDSKLDHDIDKMHITFIFFFVLQGSKSWMSSKSWGVSLLYK